MSTLVDPLFYLVVGAVIAAVGIAAIYIEVFAMSTRGTSDRNLRYGVSVLLSGIALVALSTWTVELGILGMITLVASLAFAIWARRTPKQP